VKDLNPIYLGDDLSSSSSLEMARVRTSRSVSSEKLFMFVSHRLVLMKRYGLPPSWLSLLGCMRSSAAGAGPTGVTTVASFRLTNKTKAPCRLAAFPSD